MAGGTGIIEESYVYDIMGRATKTTDGNGNESKITYDSLGRVTSATNALNIQTAYQYDDINNKLNTALQKISYDTNGNIVIDSVYTSAEYGYDAFGNETYEKDTVGNIVTKTITYNSHMKPSGEMNYQGISTGNTKTYTYDIYGRPTGTNVKNSSNTTVYNESIAYVDVTSDGLSSITKTVLGETGAPSVVSREYTNKHGEKVQEGVVESSSDTLTSKYYTYNHIGNPITVKVKMPTEGGGSVDRIIASYIYDYAGNVTRETDTNSKYVSYAYDAAGRKISATDKKGTTSSFTYDDAGRLLKEEIPITSVDTSVKKYYYDNNGNIIRQTQSDGADNEHTYDAGGRLTLIKQKNGTEYEYTKYVYDIAGKMSSMYTGILHLSGRISNNKKRI
ncbi:MAG: hypothetical protein VB118_08995 [Oscillospiraceae bacterium]|nr:hypothetical protein [Oscillospiraceae bacterium]